MERPAEPTEPAVLRHDEAHYPLHDLAAIAREQTSDAGEKDRLGWTTGRHFVTKCANEKEMGSCGGRIHSSDYCCGLLGRPLRARMFRVSSRRAGRKGRGDEYAEDYGGANQDL